MKPNPLLPTTLHTTALSVNYTCDPFPKNRGKKEKNSNSSVKKPGKHHVTQVMKVHITNDVMWISHISRYMR